MKPAQRNLASKQRQAKKRPPASAAAAANAHPLPQQSRTQRRRAELAQRRNARQALLDNPLVKARLQNDGGAAALEANLAKVKQATANSPKPATPDPTANRFAPLMSARQQAANLHNRRWMDAMDARKARVRQNDAAAKKQGQRDHFQNKMATLSNADDATVRKRAGDLKDMIQRDAFGEAGTLVNELEGILQRKAQAEREKKQRDTLKNEYAAAVREENKLYPKLQKTVEDALEKPNFPNKKELRAQLNPLVTGQALSTPPKDDLTELQNAVTAVKSRIAAWKVLQLTYDTLSKPKVSVNQSQRPVLPALGNYTTIQNFTGNLVVNVRVDWNKVYDDSGHGRAIASDPVKRASYEAAMIMGYLSPGNTGSSGVKKEPGPYVVKISYPDAQRWGNGLDNRTSLTAYQSDAGQQGEVNITFDGAVQRH